MRKSPSAERRQKNNEQQRKRLRTEKRSERTGKIRRFRGRNICESCDAFRKSAVFAENENYNGNYAAEHYKSLYKVVDSRSHIPADNDVDARKNSHNDNAPRIIDRRERHCEKTGKSVEKGRRIRNKENKHDNGRNNFQSGRIKAQPEKVGHGFGVERVRHNAGTSAEHHPGKQ